MSILFRNISLLCGLYEGNRPLRGEALIKAAAIPNAWLLVEGDTIAACGSMDAYPFKDGDVKEVVDATGRILLPSWCDSHTHLVFTGSREKEFVQKIGGATYADIAASGGGIHSTASLVRQASEAQLLAETRKRLHGLQRLGTGAIEIKSGYGLEWEEEAKMLRVIRQLRSTERIPIRCTYLAAHALPRRFEGDGDAYVAEIIQTALPRIVEEGGADYIDVFCEQGFFTPEQTEKVLRAGAAYGMKGKVHANQLNASGGVETAVRCGARSADHLECMDEAGIAALAGGDTIGTLLPGASFFLRQAPAPARPLIRAGAALALASDFNPGSAPSGNMNLIWSLACIHLRLLPEEALGMATFNGACAMDLQDRCGSLTPGKWASLMLTRPVPSLSYLPYAFGDQHIERVMLRGEWVG